jgi:F1F0 ATPase subunit 2
MMSETMILALALAAGVLLGGIFFGGLWWTVQRAVFSTSPALWFLGSMLLRTGITLAGFYFVSRGHWLRLLTCLLGFLLARVVVMRLTRAHPEKTGQLSKEAENAP